MFSKMAGQLGSTLDARIWPPFEKLIKDRGQIENVIKYPALPEQNSAFCSYSSTYQITASAKLFHRSQSFHVRMAGRSSEDGID